MCCHLVCLSCLLIDIVIYLLFICVNDLLRICRYQLLPPVMCLYVSWLCKLIWLWYDMSVTEWIKHIKPYYFALFIWYNHYTQVPAFYNTCNMRMSVLRMSFCLIHLFNIPVHMATQQYHQLLNYTFCIFFLNVYFWVGILDLWICFVVCVKWNYALLDRLCAHCLGWFVSIKRPLMTYIIPHNSFPKWHQHDSEKILFSHVKQIGIFFYYCKLLFVCYI